MTLFRQLVSHYLFPSRCWCPAGRSFSLQLVILLCVPCTLKLFPLPTVFTVSCLVFLLPLSPSISLSLSPLTQQYIAVPWLFILCTQEPCQWCLYLMYTRMYLVPNCLVGGGGGERVGVSDGNCWRGWKCCDLPLGYFVTSAYLAIQFLLLTFGAGEKENTEWMSHIHRSVCPSTVDVCLSGRRQTKSFVRFSVGLLACLSSFVFVLRMTSLVVPRLWLCVRDLYEVQAK